VEPELATSMGESVTADNLFKDTVQDGHQEVSRIMARHLDAGGIQTVRERDSKKSMRSLIPWVKGRMQTSNSAGPTTAQNVPFGRQGLPAAGRLGGSGGGSVDQHGALGGQRAHQVNRMNLGGWWKCGLAGGSAKHFIRNWQSRTLR
jgi:hypothetical protein